MALQQNSQADHEREAKDPTDGIVVGGDPFPGGKGADVRRESPGNPKKSPRWSSRSNGENGTSRPQIEIDERARSIRVRDQRIINPAHRAFCRRFLELATRQPGVSKVQIDLTSATCRMDFSSGPATSSEIARVFAGCVDGACPDQPGAGTIAGWQSDEYWITLSAYPLSGDVSLWTTLAAEPGRILFEHQGPSGNGEKLGQVAEDLANLDGVERCRANEGRHRLSVNFREANGQVDWFVDEAEKSLEQVLAAQARQGGPGGSVQPGGAARAVEVATGARRLVYLALAGGAFAMTVVAVIVPGIPTTPFLLATSYTLARSSPRLNRLLKQSRFFGPIIHEWEEYGGFSRRSKGKLMGLTAAVAAVAIAISPLSPLALFLVFFVCSSGIYGISRLPGVPSDERAGMSDERWARFALPAP
jgi:uncharacterized membrane protein YbaN (DUF454 family)